MTDPVTVQDDVRMLMLSYTQANSYGYDSISIENTKRLLARIATDINGEDRQATAQQLLTIFESFTTTVTPPISSFVQLDVPSETKSQIVDLFYKMA